MASIEFADARLDLAPQETVLECLEQAGHQIPFSCRTGVCLTCMMRVRKGAPPKVSQTGLRPGQVEQGYFLPCVCQPGEDLEIESPGEADVFGRAVASEKTQLSATVCRLRLRTSVPLFYHAGQFINLRRRDGLMRAYSLASVPSLEDSLELHIKRLGGGKMSNWIHDELEVGEVLDIHGPNGDCYYVWGMPERPLLLIGNGSGLAPLYGLVRDALADGHTGPVHLYHGSRAAKGLYYGDELRALAREWENFFYIPCLSGEADEARAAIAARAGRAEDVALADHDNLEGWAVYLCGYPPMVKTAKKRAFLAGAELQNILTDPYEMQDLRKLPRD
ncbi:MAG: FAD-binding oxidoreductase [Alphaproteobacteria bacterium]|jgi:NAD(P)H-flavin reductase/ferredoxin|nr:FAD-binding oxidoreductase [Alphaproteobacteria bacterium]